MISVTSGQTRNVTVDQAPTGLAGQVGWRIEDEADVVVVERSTTGTVEYATGAYRKALTFPLIPGRYVVVVDFPGDVEVPIDVTVVGGISLEEFKAYANVNREEKDGLLQAALDAAVDHVRGLPRQIDALPALETDEPVTVRQVVNGSRFVRVPDAYEIAEVKLDDVVITEGDYELHTRRAPTTVAVELFTRGRVAEVTGWFGIDPLPGDLRQAILALALRRYRERELGDGTSGTSEEYGVRSLPPFPKHTLEAYQVPSDVYGLA